MACGLLAREQLYLMEPIVVHCRALSSIEVGVVLQGSDGIGDDVDGRPPRPERLLGLFNEALEEALGGFPRGGISNPGFSSAGVEYDGISRLIHFVVSDTNEITSGNDRVRGEGMVQRVPSEKAKSRNLRRAVEFLRIIMSAVDCWTTTILIE